MKNTEIEKLVYIYSGPVEKSKEIIEKKRWRLGYFYARLCKPG